jgi:5-formyltetrahydrofolate cyclo-ligase
MKKCKGLTCVISFAYSIAGFRIGKGEGYADLEFAMMMKMDAVNQDTAVVATVHDCQVNTDAIII